MPDVFRRGAAYWWRRSLAWADGNSAPITLSFSLWTKDLGVARRRPAAMTGQSEASRMSSYERVARFDTRHGSVLFTGDTGPSATVNKLARNVDLLVSEVVDVPSIMAMINRQPNLPRASVQNIEAHMRDEHLTPEAVGRMAAVAGAKKVLLTHYATLDDTAATEAKYVAAVRSVYNGRVIAGRDLTQEPVAAGR